MNAFNELALRHEASEPPAGVAAMAGATAALAEPGEDGAGLVLHLGELVAVVRARLNVGRDLGDEAILASLAAIASRTSMRERWRVAFNSSLGRRLAARGSDLNTALNTLLALVPPPPS